MLVLLQAEGGEGVVGPIIAVLVALLFVYCTYKSIYFIKEKETVVIEFFGRFAKVLHSGPHFVPWPFYQPKTYTWKYYITQNGQVKAVEQINHHIILTKSEVMDFPKQDVISRDNARVTLDAVINYKVTKPEVMIYGVQNLPYMLSKLLQAQIRNVAGTLDVDSIVDDTTALTGIQYSLNQIAMRWGVTVEKVGIQHVEARQLKDVLAKRKQAELQNKEIIIQAKTTKQKTVVLAEGERDKIVTEARGALQQAVSRARGDAQAIINKAGAEAKSVKEIARAVVSSGENPTEYLLAVKYIDALQAVLEKSRNTTISMLPKKGAFLFTSQALGMNTILPRGAGKA